MRGLIEGLESPAPLVANLPAIYQEDPLTGRFTLAFDDALATVILTLDNLDAYADPALAPRDFVDWLAGWVGFPIGEAWPEERSRQLIAEAVELYRWRGTIRGLRALLAVYTGLEPEVTDTGAVTWTTTPGGDGSEARPPAAKPAGARRATGKARAKARSATTGAEAAAGEVAPHLLVRVRAPKAGGVDVRQLEALILAAKPAHVPHTLELLA